MKTTTQRGGGSLAGPTIKIALLGAGLALAIAAALPLVGAHAWGWLAVLAATTTLLFYIYLTPRHIPAKYLVPGTIFLLAFQVAAGALHGQHRLHQLRRRAPRQQGRGDHRRAGRVREQVPGSQEYDLAVATREGAIVFLLVDKTGATFVGDGTGLHPAPVHRHRRQDRRGRRVHPAEPRRGQPAQRRHPRLQRADRRGRGPGVAASPAPTTARPPSSTTAACDCVTDRGTGKQWTADNDTGGFVAADGERLPQGWKVTVGFSNFTRVLTDSRISGHFLGSSLWNFAFAIVSVLATFGLGLGCALALNADRVGGTQRLPVAAGPAVRHAGLRGAGLAGHVQPATSASSTSSSGWTSTGSASRGRPGSRSSSSTCGWASRTCSWCAPGRCSRSRGDVTRGGRHRRRRRLPGLPLDHPAAAAGRRRPAADRLVRVQLQQLHADLPDHRGRAVPPDNPSIGATDLLITYTYRLAFGGSGAQLRLRRGDLGLHLPHRGPGLRDRLPPRAASRRRSYRMSRGCDTCRHGGTATPGICWPCVVSRSSRSCSWCRRRSTRSAR